MAAKPFVSPPLVKLAGWAPTTAASLRAQAQMALAFHPMVWTPHAAGLWNPRLVAEHVAAPAAAPIVALTGRAPARASLRAQARMALAFHPAAWASQAAEHWNPRLVAEQVVAPAAAPIVGLTEWTLATAAVAVEQVRARAAFAPFPPTRLFQGAHWYVWLGEEPFAVASVEAARLAWPLAEEPVPGQEAQEAEGAVSVLPTVSWMAVMLLAVFAALAEGAMAELPAASSELVAPSGRTAAGATAVGVKPEASPGVSSGAASAEPAAAGPEPSPWAVPERAAL